MKLSEGEAYVRCECDTEYVVNVPDDVEVDNSIYMDDPCDVCGGIAAVVVQLPRSLYCRHE